MTRSIWKGPFVDLQLNEKSRKIYLNQEEKKLLKHGLEDQQFYLNLLD